MPATDGKCGVLKVLGGITQGILGKPRACPQNFPTLASPASDQIVVTWLFRALLLFLSQGQAASFTPGYLLLWVCDIFLAFQGECTWQGLEN